MLFRVWSQCVIADQDPVATKPLCAEVAATDGAGRYRTPSSTFPNIFAFEEGVISSSGVPSTFTPLSGVTPEELPRVAMNNILAANNIADLDGLNFGDGPGLEMSDGLRNTFVDPVRLYMLDDTQPIWDAGSADSDGWTLDLCVPVVTFDRFGEGRADSTTFHYQVQVEGDSVTSVRKAGVLAQPAVCASGSLGAGTG